MKKMFIGALLLGMVGVGYAFKQRALPVSSTKTQVVASFYPLAYFASQIAGDRAEVTTLTPAGAEPHDYELSTQDSARIERAKLLILNGGHLEAWGDKIQENLQGSGVKVISVGEAVLNSQQDPHVWLDPKLAIHEVISIAQALAEVDPANASTYQVNAQSLTQRLAQLDQAYQKGLAVCQRKDLVTSHEAFGYLATAYGLNQVAIAGLSPDSEPSAQQLAAISQFVHTHQVTTIFFESLVSPKLSETIASETGAKTAELNPLEGLSEQQLKQGEDYFSIMRDNLRALQGALGCSE